MSDAKPKNKFFTKPAWLKDQALNKVKNDSKPDEKNDATSIFARSTGTVSDVLAEQKRKEAVKAEKKAQKAKIKEDADAPRRKRRKTSEEGDYEGGRVKKDSISPRHTKRSDTSSSPKSLSKRYEATILENLKKQSAAIVLSDSSENEDIDPVEQQHSLTTRSKPEPIRKPRAKQESQQEEEPEAFPEIAARARERARQAEQERKQSASRHHGSESPAPTDTGPNPVINLLVYSNIEGTEPLMVRRKWNQTFREVKHAWLNRQSNMTEARKKQIFFTWRGKKTFDVATCKSLGIKLDQFGNAEIPTDQGTNRGHTADQIVLIATTDEQVKIEKEQEEAERLRKEKAEQEPEPEPVSEKSNKLRLILKAKGYPDCKLGVPTDTTVERLIGAFRNTNNIPASKDIALSFDGEDLESEMTMVDADIEDMNMIEVRIR